MSDVKVKKPQVDEWWRTRGGDIRYVAADVSGVLSGENPLIAVDEFDYEWRYSDVGEYYIGHENDLVEHLPDCTGWDWVPKESTGCPVESPDYWEVQDRVPARKGIDERAWDDGGPLEWNDAGIMCGWNPMPMHGTQHNKKTLRLRCRRKDLPPLETQKTKPPEPPKPEPATRTIILKQWIVWDMPGSEYEIWSVCRPPLFRNVHETGQTKEEKIPINPK